MKKLLIKFTFITMFIRPNTRQVALAPAGLFTFYSRQSRSTAGCLESVY